VVKNGLVSKRLLGMSLHRRLTSYSEYERVR